MGNTAWDPWSDPAHARRYDEATNRLFYRSVMAALLRASPPLAGRGLDLGCGSGFSLEVLLDACADVRWVGADASFAMVAEARRKPEFSDLPLVQADAARLPFRNDSFDVVVSSFAWHWFGPGAGEEVRRILKPGGLLLATVPLRQSTDALGNRLLSQTLMANRRTHQRRISQGMRFEETTSVLPGESSFLRHESVVIEEVFRDSESMLNRLASRGALAAIFGGDLSAKVKVISDAVAYAWPFAIVHARKA